MATCSECGEAIAQDTRGEWVHDDTGLLICGSNAEVAPPVDMPDVWERIAASLDRIAAAAERLATPFASFEGTEEKALAPDVLSPGEDEVP